MNAIDISKLLLIRKNVWYITFDRHFSKLQLNGIPPSQYPHYILFSSGKGYHNSFTNNTLFNDTQCFLINTSLWLVVFVVVWFIMMTSSNGNIFRVNGHLCGELTGPGEFPTQRPVMRSFDTFFDLRPNTRLSKQSWGWWFETLSRPLWRHCNVLPIPRQPYDRHGVSIENLKYMLTLIPKSTEKELSNKGLVYIIILANGCSRR